MLPKALLLEVEFGAWKAEIENSRELREIFMNSNPLIHTCALARKDSKLPLPGLSTENCSKTVLRGKWASGAHAGPFWSGAAAPREAGRGVAKRIAISVAVRAACRFDASLCVNGADVCHAINSCETRRSSKPS